VGRRADVLAEMLPRIGIGRASQKPPPVPSLATLPSRHPEVLRLFELLGGVGASPALRTGPWDIACADGVLVELDEQLHFNRYRAVTLGSEWSPMLPWYVTYVEQTVAHEGDCLKTGSYGRKWSNTSCERLFGSAAEPGILAGAGSPRWKQRALYDAMKDASVGQVRLARLSVFDDVGGIALGSALDRPGRLNLEALRDLFDVRLT
jgi:hypothetical protein